jgi:hypothetical protein
MVRLLSPSIPSALRQAPAAGGHAVAPAQVAVQDHEGREADQGHGHGTLFALLLVHPIAVVLEGEAEEAPELLVHRGDEDGARARWGW